MGTWSIWHWIVVLVIVLLIFGTRKLGDMGKDLGKAVRGFKDGVKESAADKPAEGSPAQQYARELGGRTIDAEVKDKQKA